MDSNTINDYFLQKMSLLKECLCLSEEFISHIDNWELLAGILSKREKVINRLNKLDESFDSETLNSCSAEQKSRINQLIDLIASLDNDSMEIIRLENRKLLDSMKANIKEQKLLKYKSTSALTTGRLLDKKK